MKALLISLFTFLFISGCQREIDSPLVDNNQNDTDTSFIASVTEIYYGLSNPADTFITTFRNNTINGTKGFITYNYFNTTNHKGKSLFSYNTTNRLTEITSYDTIGNTPHLNRTKIRWQEQLIRNILIQEDNTVYMNRNYSYDNSGDTLFIRYEALWDPLSGDSTSYVVLTDTGFTKKWGIYETGIYNNIITNDQFAYIKQTSFVQTGNDITKMKEVREDFVTAGTVLPQHTYDSSITDISRFSLANNFWTDLENKMIGKELKILSYSPKDTVYSFITANYFSFGDEESLHRLENDSKPASTARITKTVLHDGVLALQELNKLISKSDYTVDANGRIKTIKVYNTQTNQLVKETFITYY